MNKKMSFFPFVIAKPLKRLKQSLLTSFLSSVIAKPPRRMKQSLCMSLRAHLLSFQSYVRNLILAFFSSVIANPLERMKQSLCMSLRETVGLAAISILFSFTLPSFVFAEEKIPVFPTTPVDVYAIYTSLAVFWFAIIGLIVIIKMKLNEIKRIQKLGIDKEDVDAPILE